MDRQALKKYFFVEPKNMRSYILWDNTIVNLELGIPSNALELYKSGKFDYLRLKTGAQELFENESEEFILKLIERSKFRSDVLILSKLIESKEAKKIVSSKLKLLKAN